MPAYACAHTHVQANVGMAAKSQLQKHLVHYQPIFMDK